MKLGKATQPLPEVSTGCPHTWSPKGQHRDLCKKLESRYEWQSIQNESYLQETLPRWESGKIISVPDFLQKQHMTEELRVTSFYLE